ncbi:MAG TPA: hypothetical protein VK814_07610 [Acidobacteriaceae bacterium]|jgi:hypothetical protein|nr:hypothetical protein [Acidobacteriaceae bacterium]
MSRRPRSFVEAVCFIQPWYVLLAGILPGFLLIFGSMAVHAGLVTAWPPHAPVARQVGYLHALNWSLCYALLFPVLLYLMASAIGGLAKALGRLHDCNMVRTPDLKPAVARSLIEKWLSGNVIRKTAMIVFAIATPACIAFIEWFTNNFWRLVHPQRYYHPPPLQFSDYDWGLTGIMQHWSMGGNLANAAFDLAAFTMEGLLLSSLLAFFVSVLDLGRVIPTGQINDEFILLPDLDGRDERLGFEVFEPALENLLAAALVAYLICFLVRLQGAYMASNVASSLADFITKDFNNGVLQAAAGAKNVNLGQVLLNLVNLHDQQVRGMLAWLMSVFLAIFSMVAVVWTVRAAALSARTNAREAIHDGRLGLTPAVAAAANKRLDKMAVWPLGYLRLDVLGFWIAIAVGTLMFYRVGLFVAGMVTFFLFAKLFYRLVKPDRSSSARTETDAPSGNGSSNVD